jgi:EPS-associated MarR family transcriptional regulator
MLRSMVERSTIDDELRYRLLGLLAANPRLSQREIAHVLELSLGKVNYCLRTLAEKGWVKARNFKNSRNKLAYMYLLTPSGLEEKARVTYQFLLAKLTEVDTLRKEIEALRDEVVADRPVQDLTSSLVEPQ